MKRVIKITSVEFSANVEIGKFQHVHIGATASVSSNEDPNDVLLGVKEFVAAALARAKRGVVVEESFAQMLDDE